MKNVISVDSKGHVHYWLPVDNGKWRCNCGEYKPTEIDNLVHSFAEEIADQFGGDYDEHPNPDEEKRAKASLNSLLISKLPEKHVCTDECKINSNEWRIGHQAYKDAESNCIDDMRKSIDEMFNKEGK